MDVNAAKNFEAFQKLSEQNMDSVTKLMDDWTRGWQAIGAEMTDFTKRSLEDGTTTFGKLMTAKSFEQAVEIQSNYAKRACDEYMHQMTKVGEMYASLAKQAYSPMDKILSGGR